MPRKVCHISTVHSPFDQRIFHRECHSLVEGGWETHLLVQLDDAEMMINDVHLHSVGKERLNAQRINALQRLTRLRKAYTLAIQLRADVYHLHDPELIPLGLLLKLRLKATVIFDSHENNVAYFQHKNYINSVLRSILIAGTACAERLAARYFDAIVTADQGVADLYTKTYRARRVEVIYNFPLVPLFTLDAAHAPPEQPFDLVYHGTIPKYHLEVAFEVAERLRERGVQTRWLFFGKCPAVAWAQEELVRRQLNDYFVIDANPVPHAQVAARVTQAKIGFIPLPDLPKFQMNIPTKLFEFMALKMPVVLSNLPPSRPFVGDGTCAIMVPSDDYGAYADAIVKLLDDPVLRAQMGEIGRERIDQSFNWENESKKLLSLYDEL